MEDTKVIIANLEKRIARGEVYLAEHPEDEHSRAGYWKLVDDLTQILVIQEIRASINTVTLAFPPGVAWSKTKDSPEFTTVAVVMHGTVGENQMGIGDLVAMNETVAITRGGSNQHEQA